MNSKSNRRSRATSIQINAKDIVLKPFTFSFEDDSAYAGSLAKIADPLRRTKL